MKDMLKKRNIMLKYEWYVKKDKYNAKIWMIC